MDTTAVAARLRQFEGAVPYMYKCTGGEVTVGVGHAMQSAADAVSLRWEINGAPAGAQAVAADWEKVYAAPKGMAAGYYAPLTQCRMADLDIGALAEADIASFEERLSRALPGWSGFPESAQEALFDMGFNLGVDGLLTKFPMMLKAVAAGDWATAAQQCHRMGISDARNQETANLLRQAASAAAAG